MQFFYYITQNTQGREKRKKEYINKQLGIYTENNNLIAGELQNLNSEYLKFLLQ